MLSGLKKIGMNRTGREPKPVSYNMYQPRFCLRNHPIFSQVVISQAGVWTLARQSEESCTNFVVSLVLHYTHPVGFTLQNYHCLSCKRAQSCSTPITCTTTITDSHFHWANTKKTHIILRYGVK